MIETISLTNLPLDRKELINPKIHPNPDKLFAWGDELKRLEFPFNVESKNYFLVLRSL